MGQPEGRWSTVSSCYLHKRHLLSCPSFKILFLKLFILIAWSSDATIVLPVSVLATDTVNHIHYFLYMLLENCPFSLFSYHLSFIFSTIMPFINLVPHPNALLRLLAACNFFDSVFIWYVLTICISRSSLLGNFWYVSFLSLYYSSSSVSWENTSDLRLSLGDAVHGLLELSLFSYPIFAVLFSAS